MTHCSFWEVWNIGSNKADTGRKTGPVNLQFWACSCISAVPRYAKSKKGEFLHFVSKNAYFFRVGSHTFAHSGFKLVWNWLQLLVSILIFDTSQTAIKTKVNMVDVELLAPWELKLSTASTFSLSKTLSFILKSIVPMFYNTSIFEDVLSRIHDLLSHSTSSWSQENFQRLLKLCFLRAN